MQDSHSASQRCRFTNTVHVKYSFTNTVPGTTIHKHGAGKSHVAGKSTYHKLFGSFIAPLFVTGPQTAQQPEINSI